VLFVVAAILLLAGSAQAVDCDDSSSRWTLRTLCREFAVEPILFDVSQKSSGSVEGADALESGPGNERTASGELLFGARFRERPNEVEIETADANTPLGLGARLQLRFPTLKGYPVKPDRLELRDFSYATLRGGRIKLGEHPFLPWMEIHSAYDFLDRGFLSDHQQNREGIDDRLRGSTRRLRGGYFQVGYFFHEWWERVPPSLEIAGRFALVEQEASSGSGLLEEWTLGANWFFRGYDNRIAAGVSYIAMDHPDADESAMRFQVRWDIAF
jgi:hypothetical protein